jgi:phospholipid:diacylglycerol acyltransferase
VARPQALQFPRTPVAGQGDANDAHLPSGFETSSEPPPSPAMLDPAFDALLARAASLDDSSLGAALKRSLRRRRRPIAQVIEELKRLRQVPLWRDRYRRAVVVLLVVVLGVVLALLIKERERAMELASQLAEQVNLSKLYTLEPKRPGLKLAEEGVRAHYPLVLLPGLVTTGLEIWQGDPCIYSRARQRLWGTSNMLSAALFDPKCFLRHLMLDLHTGLDPPGVKVRPAEGFGSADYLIGDFWVWAKVIENAADLGYDPSNLYMEPYDWRLSLPDLERRDRFFTRLAHKFELIRKLHGRPAVVATHSMGGGVLLYFLHWVESDLGGARGPDWVAQHMHAMVSIGTPYLGVPKAVSSLLAGEMKDTAFLPRALTAIRDRYFNKNDVRDFLRSFRSIMSMWPLGGNKVWGATADGEAADEEGCFAGVDGDGEPCSGVASVLTFHEPGEGGEGAPPRVRNLDMEAATNELRRAAPDYMRSLDQLYRFDYAPRINNSLRRDPRTWFNPLLSELPRAPNFTIYCIYGVNTPTERGYYFMPDTSSLSDPLFPYTINTSVRLPASGVQEGIKLVNGDLTVPLLSLGLMCVDGWRAGSPYNPHGVGIVTREYDENVRRNASAVELSVDGLLRGGSKATTHVDIMGGHDAIRDILLVSTGLEQRVTTQIVSNIRELARRVDLFGERGRAPRPQ